MLPRAVLFDVGGVLLRLNPWPDVFLGVEKLAGREDLLAALEALRSSEPYRAYECGEVGDKVFFDTVRTVFGVPLGDEEIRHQYLRILGPPVDGMPKLLADLKSIGVRIYGLSDTSPIHLEALYTYPAVRALERLVTSCETGHRKPSARAFLAALELVKSTPSETVFVDDRQPNVEGARAVGMRAILFRGVEALREELGLGSEDIPE